MYSPRSVRLWWLFGLLISAAARGAEDPPEVLEVRAVYQRARSLIDAKMTRVVVVAEGKEGWIRVKGLEAVPRGDDFIARAAVIHVADEEVLMVELWIQTPSGDWQNRSEHYYRADGRLAFVFEEHRTFQINSEDDRLPRPFVMEARRYFDPAGKRIRAAQVVRAANGKTVPSTMAHRSVSAPTYLRVDALPFRSLVR